MKKIQKKLAKSVEIVYTQLRCDIKSEDAEGCRKDFRVFPRSNVQFKKPGDKVTVLNMKGKFAVFSEERTRYARMCVQSPLVVLKLKVRKGGDFFYG